MRSPKLTFLVQLLHYFYLWKFEYFGFSFESLDNVKSKIFKKNQNLVTIKIYKIKKHDLIK